MKIMIALDASAHSQRALDFVSRVRWPAGSRVVVVTAVQPVTNPAASVFESAVPAPEAVDESVRQGEELLKNAKHTLREVGLATEGMVLSGDAREAVIRAASEERADLLVAGSHGRSGFAKLMLGSVSEHLVAHAPCNVLVVKEDYHTAGATKGHVAMERRG